MATVTPGTEHALVAALRRGDEAAFLELVQRHHTLMVRVAQGYVRTRAVAEEVVQETWLGVLNGIGTFESRATLKTWIFRILVNRAKTRAERESRTVPLSALQLEGEDEPAVDPSRFLDAAHPRWPGHWAAPPQRWDELPEEHLLARETLGLTREAIDALPVRQREVILLRDVDGWSPEEVCVALGLSDGNQRVLLHRALAGACGARGAPRRRGDTVTTADDLNCRELVELVTDWLEGALPAREHARVELHLAACEGCAAYVEQMRETVRIAGRLTEADLEPAVRDDLVAAFRGWRASTA